MVYIQYECECQKIDLPSPEFDRLPTYDSLKDLSLFICTISGVMNVSIGPNSIVVWNDNAFELFQNHMLAEFWYILKY